MQAYGHKACGKSRKHGEEIIELKVGPLSKQAEEAT